MNITVRIVVSVLDLSTIPEFTASVIRLRTIDERMKIISVLVFCCNSDVICV